MTIVKLKGGRLAIYSAIALAEQAMRQIEALGTPTLLIVPSAIHRPTWRRVAGLERILVAHGAPIDNARETLLELAAA